jgi:hypothetical protein
VLAGQCDRGAGRIGRQCDRGDDSVKAHNNNLILQRGQHSDVDGRQGDVIPISDQVK